MKTTKNLIGGEAQYVMHSLLVGSGSEFKYSKSFYEKKAVEKIAKMVYRETGREVRMFNLLDEYVLRIGR